jgi:RNA polymerase sigma-70 factor (ECF subfamily)
MNDSQATRQSLLARVRDKQDNGAWAQLVDIYSPLVYHFLRRRGLQDADAADITQDVFRTVVQKIDRFRRDDRKGAFRSWLFAITRTRLSDFASRQKRQVSGSGDTRALELLNQQPADQDEEAFIEREHQESVFKWAARIVQREFAESSWQAFWRTHVEGQPINGVAKSLDMSVEAVYVARSRVVARLKNQIQQLAF